MFYKDNWLSWSYDDVKFGKKLHPKAKFEFQFKQIINRPLKSHKEEDRKRNITREENLL